MLIYEMKLQGTEFQYIRLDEAIRTGRFVRNSIIRGWMDGQIKSRNDTRTHKCPDCGYIADRDQNAAINILKSALKQLSNTVGQTGINASGEIDLCLIRETQSSKSARSNRKRKSK